MQNILNRATLLLFCLLPLPLAAQTAAPTPLVTQSASTPGAGVMALSVSASYAHGLTLQPLLGSEDGNLIQAPIIKFSYGLGERGEISIEWPAFQEFDSDQGDSSSDAGDVHLWTKVGFRQDAERGPVLGFRFGLKVPNAAEENGLGTDEADVFGAFLLEQRMYASSGGRDALFRLNLGLGILGDPTENGEQEDAIGYGLSLTMPFANRHHFLLEAAGSLDGSSRRETGDKGEGRVGFRFAAGPGSFHTAASVGYADASPNLGAVAGYTWRFPADG